LRILDYETSMNTALEDKNKRTYLRGRIHEVKLEQILDTQTLEQQDRVRQVGTLNLWNRAFKELVSVCHLSVQPVTEPSESQRIENTSLSERTHFLFFPRDRYAGWHSPG
jgi:hypothetical protein